MPVNAICPIPCPTLCIGQKDVTKTPSGLGMTKLLLNGSVRWLLFSVKSLLGALRIVLATDTITQSLLDEKLLAFPPYSENVSRSPLACRG